MKRSRTMAGSAVLALASIATMATATTASAAPARTTAAYNGACGSGYSVVNSVPVSGKGTVYLTYSAKTGKNCVITQRNNTGKAVHIYAYLETTEPNSTTVQDRGNYTSYAGPIYLAAKGRCVNWGGTIETVGADISGSNCGRLAAGTVTHH